MAVFLFAGEIAAAVNRWVPARLRRPGFPVCVECLPRTLEDLALSLAWPPRRE